MEREPIKIIKSKLLIVEGRDEENIFNKVLEICDVKDVQVIPLEGKNDIRNKVNALSRMSEFPRVTDIGFTRDADADPKGALQSICEALKEAGLQVPKNQLEIAKGKPNTAIMILPEPGKKGMLEDVFYAAVEEQKEMRCVQQYIECIGSENIKNMAKTKLYAFLAVKRPGCLLGETIRKDFWELDHPAFDNMKRFIKLIHNS